MNVRGLPVSVYIAFALLVAAAPPRRRPAQPNKGPNRRKGPPTAPTRSKVRGRCAGARPPDPAPAAAATPAPTFLVISTLPVTGINAVVSCIVLRKISVGGRRCCPLLFRVMTMDHSRAASPRVRMEFFPCCARGRVTAPCRFSGSYRRVVDDASQVLIYDHLEQAGTGEAWNSCHSAVCLSDSCSCRQCRQQ